MQHNYQNWKLDLDADHILWLTVDREGSSVNSLNRALLSEFDQILDEIKRDKEIKAVIIRSGKSSGFIAGADIEQFIHIKSEDEAFDLVRQAQKVFDKLDHLPVPVVAMIDGFCLGGGLELALACDYRIAEDGPRTTIGAPEVKLGLQPGWGGTVRLPNLIGVLSAMELNLSGRSIDGKTAEKMGVVDAAVPQRQLEHAARYYALNKLNKHQPIWWQALLTHRWLRPLVAKKLYAELAKKVNKEHYPAPYAIVSTWEKNGAKGEEAMIDEARSISQLMMTPTSRNLVRVFFLQTAMKAIGKDTKFKPSHIHVIGAGTMGGDIAAWCVFKGYYVSLQDCAPDYIAPAVKRAYELFKKKLKNPRLVQAAMDRLIPDVEGHGISKADIVIEAISENIADKQSLYQKIEPLMKTDAILATNTSSLPLDELNTVLKHPERLVGIHFFNPVSQMQLVEVVQGVKTDPHIYKKSLAFVRGIDRLALPVKSMPGFLVNRVLMPYLLEAMKLYEEGVSPALIDEAAVAFGMPMGPMELADTVGLDICLSVATILANHYRLTVPHLLQEMVAKRELGRKTKKGFYQYEKNKPVKLAVVADPQQIEQIQNRLILMMLNESVRCLREGVVESQDLVDSGMIFGTGFAPFRGGPLHYAKSIGFDKLMKKFHQLEIKYGNRFRPDEGWKFLEEKLQGVAKASKTTVKTAEE